MSGKAKPVVPLTPRQRRLAEDHMDLVVQCLRQLRVRPDTTEWDDCWQAGAVGLMRATQTWPGSGEFGGYARVAVRNTIIKHRREDNVILIRQNRFHRDPDLRSGGAACFRPCSLDALKLKGFDVRSRDEDDPGSGLAAEVAAAVDVLSPSQRAAVVECCIDGKSLREFARDRGVRFSAAWQARMLAIRNLKKILGPIVESREARKGA